MKPSLSMQQLQVGCHLYLLVTSLCLAHHSCLPARSGLEGALGLTTRWSKAGGHTRLQRHVGPTCLRNDTYMLHRIDKTGSAEWLFGQQSVRAHPS
jgi:hypothetical protein